jgi:hypothetical protein
MSLSETLKHLYPGINLYPGGECEIVEGRIAKWRRAEKQPTDAELQAAESAALAALAAEAAKRVESDTARSEAKQAYSELQPLIEHKDPAIALLAAIMQKHLLATVGR